MAALGPKSSAYRRVDVHYRRVGAASLVSLAPAALLCCILASEFPVPRTTRNTS